MSDQLTPAPAPDALICVVTDDDAMSRQLLEAHVAHTPQLVLAGSFADGLALLEFLRTKPDVDILFLDVQMPHVSGLDVIRQLPVAPAVILTTGRADFAVEAFELKVADYLVKPIEYPRFLQAVERVRSRIVRRPAPAAAAAASVPRENALFVKSGGRLTRVPHADILYVEAVNDQAVVVTTNKQFSTNQVLRDVAGRLPAPQFVRVHRTFVVNRRKIEAVEDYVITLEGGRTIPIGRTYRDEFLAGFNSL